MSIKKRIIIKIGSNILTTASGKLDINQINNIVTQCSEAIALYPQLSFLIVTSGAITCGSEALAMDAVFIPEKQAAAAVGQIQLMNTYLQAFSSYKHHIAQILLTKEGLSHHVYRRNIKTTLETLEDKEVIPILNENDSVATDEIGERFGDNDELSGLVAELFSASTLMLLSDKDGLFTKHPDHEGAELLKKVPRIDDAILALADDRDLSRRNRGGMSAKLNCAQYCSQRGIDVHLVNGRKTNIILDVLAGKDVGTFFPKQEIY